MDPLSPYSKAGRVLWAHFTEERTEVQTAGGGLGPAPGHRGSCWLTSCAPSPHRHPRLFPWPLSRDESLTHSLTHSLRKLSEHRCGPVLGARSQDHLFWNCLCAGGMAKESTADATASPSP